ncbi:unnamed protein product [Arabis nemorensis]|uniref:ARID domain-containing protein n=1 Tax=Arabis nemorensis TaxID=586526 RepID=A0A565C124_9BRAS|nr:unnamed protein product [Arabis nemorensis]
MDKIVQTYSSPLSSYEEVVANKDLFMSTLKKLHSEMGTKFWIPKVRFRDLDLHKLFVEVTSRGGIEKIVREEKWKDVFDAFNFPKSQRNPIFTQIVRRHYYSLLHNYEIIYFFKARDQFPPLIGFVYGKIRSAYLVTFTMGSLKLEGVLFESTEKRVTHDPEKQSYNVFPNTLTDKANPYKLFEAKSNPYKAILQNNEVGIDDVPLLQQRTPKKETEADASMYESEEEEGYSSSYSENDENYYSDCESEQRFPRDESDSCGESQ